jgi:hypothetical protein
LVVGPWSLVKGNENRDEADEIEVIEAALP